MNKNNWYESVTDSEKEIFRMRANLLSKKVTFTEVAQQELMLIFLVGDGRYGLLYTAIDKVITSPVVTAVPGVDKLIGGLIYFEGETWPVISSQVLCEANNISVSRQQNLLLLRQMKRRLALAVDQIVGQEIYDEQLVSKKTTDNQCKYLNVAQGIYRGDTALLNVDMIFSIVGNYDKGF